MDISTVTGDVVSSDNVEGTAVYNNAGDKLGSIDNLMIDKYSGHVQYAVLEFGGFLGIGTDRYPIPWQLLKYEPNKGGYIVPLDKSRLKDAPKYQEEAMPPYDAEYGRQIDRYYNVYI